MSLGKEKLIPIIALVLLLIGTSSSAYVYSIQSNADSIKVNDQQYTIDQIFFIAEKREFETLDFSGVALDDLIIKAGVGCLKCHKYTIIGSDGYAKTVTWENMQNGLLTKEGLSVFTDLPKAFRVKNVVEIEVI